MKLLFIVKGFGAFHPLHNLEGYTGKRYPAIWDPKRNAHVFRKNTKDPDFQTVNEDIQRVTGRIYPFEVDVEPDDGKAFAEVDAQVQKAHVPKRTAPPTEEPREETPEEAASAPAVAPAEGGPADEAPAEQSEGIPAEEPQPAAEVPSEESAPAEESQEAVSEPDAEEPQPEELPETYKKADLNKMTGDRLREICRGRGITGFSKKKDAQLVDLILKQQKEAE